MRLGKVKYLVVVATMSTYTAMRQDQIRSMSALELQIQIVTKCCLSTSHDKK